MVLYLSRSGGTAGPGTFVDSVISAAGGRNIITKSGWRGAELESLITLKPDLIITSFFENGAESAQSKGVRNRALQNLIADTPHVNVAGKYWPCAGPGLENAQALIIKAIRALT
jgi:iron complex transport system substrate-binding protein